MFTLFFACLAPKRRCGYSSGTTAVAAAAAASHRKVFSTAVARFKTKPRVHEGSSPVRCAGRPPKKQHERCPRTSPAPLSQPLSAASPPSSSAVASMNNYAAGEETSSCQPSFSPSYLLTDAMPVRSHFMNPVDFLSSSEPLMLTPEEKAAEKAEKARMVALQEDARALAALFARELAKRKAKAITAGVIKARRPAAAAAVPASSKPARLGGQQQSPLFLPTHSIKLAPVAPKPQRSHHKASVKSEKLRVKALKRGRKLKTSRRPRALAAQRSSPISRKRGRHSKMPAAASVSMRQPHPPLQRRPSRPPLRLGAAARMRVAAPSHKGGRRAARAPKSFVMRPLSKSTVKAWRLAQQKKRVIGKARHGKRKK
ncbi:hypothetical protein conserved [Leishmania donovani]|nr:hypothetical protein conserved [Leishmania donovani]